MAGIAIRSPEELMSFMCFAQHDEKLWDLVNVESLKLVFTVSIDGVGRDGRIDVIGAKFIQNLQSRSLWALKNYGQLSGEEQKELLRVKVSDGSDRNEVDYTEIAKKLVRKMTPGQVTTAVVVGMLLATGYFSYAKYSTEETERMKAQIQASLLEKQMNHDEQMLILHSKSTSQLVSGLKGYVNNTAEGLTRNGVDPYLPIRGVVKGLRDGDRISVNNEEYFSQAEAMERLGPEPDAKTLYYVHGDGEFILSGIDLLGSEPAIRIKHSTETVVAHLGRLAPELKQSILQAVDESLESRTPQTMQLQVDVYFSIKKIHHAVVIGVGPRRPGVTHFDFTEIPKKVPFGAARRQGE